MPVGAALPVNADEQRVTAGETAPGPEQKGGGASVAEPERKLGQKSTEVDDYWAEFDWTDEDESALEEWEDRRRKKLAEANEY